MPKKPLDIRYSRDHEWVRLDGDIATIGISDHAQEALGDLVFVELPQVDRDLEAGEACAVVESVKAASDVFSPLAGKVVETNGAVVDDPAIINGDSEGEGWLFRLEIDDPEVVDSLMDATAYAAFLEEEGA